MAEALPATWQVQWLGVPDRLERELVPSHYPLHTVRAGGLQGRGLRKLWNLLQLLRATLLVRRLIPAELMDEHRRTAAAALDARAPGSRVGAAIVMTRFTPITSIITA